MIGDLHPTPDEPVCLLMDNGSFKAEATLNLRIIAEELSKFTRRVIRPISLLYSNEIDRAELHGHSAEIFEPTINTLASEGRYNVLVIPLFFGPSRALTCYLPERITQLKKTHPRLNVRVAPCLVRPDDNENYSMAKILMNGISRVIINKNLNQPAVILVDHGTPEIKVNEVRTFLARQLESLLKGKIKILAEASMERREGKEYLFNDPLLLHQLSEENFNQGDVIISLLFLLPGYHAGIDGDITQICLEAERRQPKLKTYLTELVGADENLITLLKERLDQELLAYE